MEALEKEPLRRLRQFNDAINLHLDPGIESGIKIVDSRWCSHSTLQVRQNDLEVNEDSTHKPEIGIDKSILEVNSDGFCVVLIKHGKYRAWR